MAEIQVKEVEPMTVMSLAFTGPYDQSSQKMEELMSWLLRVGHPYSAPPMGLYYDNPATAAPDALRAEVCLPIEEECEPGDDIERKEVPGATVACLTKEGTPAEVAALYPDIFAWMAENGYEYAEGEPTREIFVSMFEQVEETETMLVEIQVPVRQV